MHTQYNNTHSQPTTINIPMFIKCQNILIFLSVALHYIHTCYQLSATIFGIDVFITVPRLLKLKQIIWQFSQVILGHSRFKFLAEVLLKIQVFRDVAMCPLVRSYWSIQLQSLHLQIKPSSWIALSWDEGMPVHIHSQRGVTSQKTWTVIWYIYIQQLLQLP